MRRSTKDNPVDRGEMTVAGRCQICGQEGNTIAVPEAPTPNQFCPKCAIEYAQAPGDGEEDER